MIPDLPAAYVEHLVRPTGLGDVLDPQAAGEIGSMVGGLGARFTLTYASDGADGSVVDEVCGRPFGSAALVAPISWICTAVRGETWEEAGAHDLPALLLGLRGGDASAWLPPSVERAAEFALRAFRRALGVGVAGPADCRGPGNLVCRCIGVGDRTIRAAIAAGARDPEAVGEATGACTGCRSCRPDLLAILDEETLVLPPAPPPDRHPVERIALVHGRRLLRGLGQDLAEARFDGREVTLGFGERTAWATVRPIGAVALVRHILRETVHDDIRVTPVES